MDLRKNNMKEISLNSQATSWLIEHLNYELELERHHSETSKGIMKLIIEKLTNE